MRHLQLRLSFKLAVAERHSFASLPDNGQSTMSRATASTFVASLTSQPHSGMTVRDYYSMHFQGVIFPFTAGVALFGWRAAAVITLVVLGTAAGIAIWRRIGARGKQLEYAHAMWFSIILALML